MREQSGKSQPPYGPRHLPVAHASARARLAGLQLNPRLAPFAREEIARCREQLDDIETEAPGPERDAAVRAAAVQVERTIELARRRYRNASTSVLPRR